MNLHTHRITTEADAEAWADAQVSRRKAVLSAIGTEPMGAWAGCNGNCKQGRACDCVPDVPQDECEPATWWQDTRFMLACALGTCALAFLGWLWRVQ